MGPIEEIMTRNERRNQVLRAIGKLDEAKKLTREFKDYDLSELFPDDDDMPAAIERVDNLEQCTDAELAQMEQDNIEAACAFNLCNVRFLEYAAALLFVAPTEQQAAMLQVASTANSRAQVAIENTRDIQAEQQRRGEQVAL